MSIDKRRAYSTGTGSKQMDPTAQVFVSKVEAALDTAQARLDAATLSRLNALRHQTLAGSGKQRSRLWLPFGTLTSAYAMLLLLTVLNSPVMPLSGAVLKPSLADINLLTTPAELEFYEDYDFIQWLADTESGF